MRIVKDITDLKNILADREFRTFRIVLNGGCFSRKEIGLVKNKFHIFNNIDGSEDKLTEKQLLNKDYTNIGEALQKHALVYEED